MDDIELTCLCDLFLQSEEDISSTYLHLHECVNTIPLLSSTLLIKKKADNERLVSQIVLRQYYPCVEWMISVTDFGSTGIPLSPLLPS